MRCIRCHRRVHLCAFGRVMPRSRDRVTSWVAGRRAFPSGEWGRKSLRFIVSFVGAIAGYYFGSTAGVFYMFLIGSHFPINDHMQALFIASLVGAFIGISLGIYGGIKLTQGSSPEKENPVKSISTDVGSEAVWPPPPSHSEPPAT
jgi:hypothetical protein